MFFYFIIMLHHKHLSLGSVFLRQRRLLSCHFHHIIQIMHFFHFPKFKTLTSHLLSSDKPWLSQQSVPQRATEISVLWRNSKLVSDIEFMYFDPRRILERDVMFISLFESNAVEVLCNAYLNLSYSSFTIYLLTFVLLLFRCVRPPAECLCHCRADRINS